MALKKILLVAASVVIVFGALPSTSDAQSPTFRRHRTLRWLGQGYSDGYHRCNPGYDSGYYNPYSAHNSALASQSPEYMSAAMVRQNATVGQANRFFVGVPVSVYAAPPRVDQLMMPQPGQQIESSFAPSQDYAQPADDNSFAPSDSPEENQSEQDEDAGNEVDEDADIDALENDAEDSSVDTPDDEAAFGLPKLFTPAAYQSN